MSQILNVAPILYDGAKLNAEKFKYSDEHFEKLYQDYGKSHLIKRSGDSIVVVPLTLDSSPVEGEHVEIDLKEDLSMASSLAREAIYRQLLLRSVHISGMRPVSYLVTNYNILDDCIPGNSKILKGLGLYPKWEIDFRVVAPGESTPFVSMNLNVSTAPRISMSCSSLLSSKFPIVGYYVGISKSGRNPDLKPHFITVGKIAKILENGMLELEDTREGVSNQVDPIDVFLEPREDILEQCIKHFYKDNSSQILSAMEQRAAAFHAGDTKLSKLKSGLAVLQSFTLEFANRIPFRIGNFLSDNNAEHTSLNIKTAEKPLFVFSYGGQQNNQYNDFGIQKYGPYSKDSFSPPKPRICVICQERKKGQVELILRKFLDGIPPVEYTPKKTFEFTGLKTKFYLQDCLIEFFVSKDNTTDGYNDSITRAMQAGRNGAPWNLALIQIDGDFRQRPTNNNPYILGKARFVSQGIPVQEFTIEALGLPDQRVVWSLNNMALATYAKLGGVPWLLSAEKPITHELVFGIGSSIVQSTRLGQKERMIGITTVFSGDGNYLINNISAAVSADRYFETLLANVRTTMEKVRQSYNWQPRDSVRLIFHAFKTLKDVEIDVVKQIVGELGDYCVEFAFIHVADNHPYLLFDDQQSGIGKQKKGIYSPIRGKFLQLSEHTALACLTGGQELKKPTDGLPAPVQLILHRDSTFKDMTYLSKQVLKFGAHSWRSYQPAPMPVSVYYSQLMAQMLGQLNNVSSWNSDALYNKIGTTRWFL